MVYRGKNIFNGSKNPQFLPVMCVLCARCAQTPLGVWGGWRGGGGSKLCALKDLNQGWLKKLIS